MYPIQISILSANSQIVSVDGALARLARKSPSHGRNPQATMAMARSLNSHIAGPLPLPP